MKIPKITVTDEVKVLTLVCLLLEKSGGLTEPQLLEIVTVDDTISQFALNDALAVIENKKLAEVNNGLFTITNNGLDWLSEFEGSVAPSIRRRMVKEAQEVVRLDKLRKAVKWSVVKDSSGWVFCACFLNEINNTPVMEIKIHSKTKKAALEIQEKFLKDPAKIIKNTLSNFM
ncbi:MAG: DUF4364 family protein [Oscillospiraceae bacterium]|nr:DUF4364 family protein [Oscillospiraceae bacterium]